MSLEFHILLREDENTKMYQKSYQMWDSVWSGFYNKAEGREKFHSDPFLFNDEVCVISFQSQPVALFLLSFFEKNAKSRLHTSYVHQYPDGVIDKAIEKSSVKTVCLYSNITVHPMFRRNNEHLPCSVAELQFTLAIKRFEESQTDVLFGYCRNEKQINRMAYDHGAQVLASGVRHGCETDFIAIYRENIRFDTDPVVVKNADSIFKQKKHKISA